MIRPLDDVDGLRGFEAQSRCRAYVLGPGFGDRDKAREFALHILASAGAALVLDADGITAFRDRGDELFQAARAGKCRSVLTPHAGEFERLFPDLARDHAGDRLAQAEHAAKLSGAVVILKGPDTVIASPSGDLVVNRNATPFLATAGSGDVLAGLCGGLLAQGMPIFEAACAAVWIHAETGARFGPGLTADDLPDAIVPVLRDLAPPEYRPRASDPVRRGEC